MVFERYSRIMLPTNPLRPEVARATIWLARFETLVSAKEPGDPDDHVDGQVVTVEDLRVPLDVALYTLGYNRIVITPETFGRRADELAARLRIDHGPMAYHGFKAFTAFQLLSALLANVDRMATGLPRLLWAELSRHCVQMGFDMSSLVWLPAIQAHLGKRHLGKKALNDVKAFMHDSMDPALQRHMGVERYFADTSSPIVGLTYPEVYRLASHLGELRCRLILNAVVGDEELDLATARYELYFGLERLGVLQCVPKRAAAFWKAVDGLQSAVKRPTRVTKKFLNGISPIWPWLESYLGIFVGYGAEEIYTLSDALCMLESSVEHAPVGKHTLAALALEKIETVYKTLAVPSLVRVLADTIDKLGDTPIVAAASDATARMVADRQVRSALRDCVGAVRSWVDAQVPRRAAAADFEARVQVVAQHLGSYRIPADSARVRAFIAQFPAGQRWVGECVAGAIDYYDAEFFARSLRSGLADAEPANHVLSLLGGARKSGAFMSYILDRKVNLKYVELADFLRQDSTQRLTFLDDCCLTGTQSISILKELLGMAARRKYTSPLDPGQVERLRRTSLVLVFALGTREGLQRVRAFGASQGLTIEVSSARELTWLTEEGYALHGTGSLLDVDGNVRSPERYLADSMFSDHSRIWGANDPRIARAVCEEIGLQLIRPRAKAEGWSDERMRGSALGYSRMAGRLAFAHNVPKTTLTLIWESGEVNGRPWIPLLPSRA